MIGIGLRLSLFINPRHLQKPTRQSIRALNSASFHVPPRSIRIQTTSLLNTSPLKIARFPSSQTIQSRKYATHKDNRSQAEYDRLSQAWKDAQTEQLRRQQEGDWRVPMSEVKTPDLIRPILFLFLVGTVSYSWAAWKTVEDTKATANEILENSNPFGDFTSFLSNSLTIDSAIHDMHGRRVSEAQLRAAKQHQLAVRLGWRMNWLMGWCDQLNVPKGAKEFIGSTYLSAAKWYLDLPQYQSVTIPILMTTAAVFLGINFTRIGFLEGRAFTFLRNNLMHSAAANRSRTLLTSVFSHTGIFHLGFNGYAIFNFGALGLMAASFYHDANGNRLHTAEASPLYHYVAFFITAGTFASLSSHIFQRLLLSRASSVYGPTIAKKITGRLPGLGASGALYGMIALSCFANPDSYRLGIIGLPFSQRPAKEFFSIMAIFETGLVVFSLVRGRFFGFFDHAAHMGGALFGYVYFLYGNEFWESCKSFVKQQETMIQQQSHSKQAMENNKTNTVVTTSKLV